MSPSTYRDSSGRALTFLVVSPPGMSRSAVINSVLRTGAAATAAVLLVVGPLGGCEARPGESPAREPGTVTAAPRGRLLVLAAASLTEALGDAARAFEAAHPGTRVETSFAGSQALRLQIAHGVRADVFASANPTQTRALREAGLVDAPAPLVDNELVLVTPAGRPLGHLRELPRARRVVLAGPEVPAGVYADRFLDRADAVFGEGFARRVRARVVSREPSVRAVLAKVVLGEADAALVYRTDARAAGPGKVATVAIDDPRLAVRARYEVAVLRRAPAPELAAAFVDYLLGPSGQRFFAARGFAPRPAPAAADRADGRR